MNKIETKYTLDDIGIIVVGIAASLLYLICEKIIHLSENSTIFITIGVILLFSFFSQYLINKIRRSETALLEVKESLESMVDERTYELDDANRQLQEEIEHHKKTQEALRRNASRLDKAQEITSMGSWELDLSSGEIHWSNEMYRLFQLNPRDFLLTKETFLSFIHPDDRKKFEDAIESALLSKNPFDIEFRYLRKNNDIRIASSTGEVETDETGELLRISASFQDITEQKEAKDRLKKYEFIVNSSAEFMTLINKNHEYEAVNDAYCKAHGKNRNEILGKTVADIWGEEAYQKEIKPKLESCFAGQIVQYESSFSFSHAQREFYTITYYPYRDDAGDVTHVGVFTFNITDRKRMEKELLKAKNLAETANKTKSEFLANMSHEIRTPLNGILGLADLALSQPVGKEAESCFELIKDCGWQLLEIINDILDLSKIEAGKLELNSEAFNLTHILDSLIRLFTANAQNKDIELSYTTAPEIEKYYLGDPVRLRQVLANLIGNAIKFTEKGSVTINVSLAKSMYNAPPFAEETSKLLFSIVDTGCGISKSQLSSIFDNFTQADGSLKRKFQGTGLGLAISKRLVGLMNGEIWVESKENKGSTFYFTAVLKKQKGLRLLPKQKSESVSIGKQRRLKILVAEDNRVNQLVAKRYLENQGHSVVCVGSGREGLEALKKETFDFILMDIQMPDMDGVETTHYIRNSSSEHIDPEIPIIAMTAHALKGDKERFLAEGMDGYITKPINAEKLSEAISRILENGGKGRHISSSA